jgi:hypothetical protein
MDHFEKVKGYLRELDFDIIYEDLESELVVVDKEDSGIKNMLIDCEESIVIFEQFLFEIKKETPDLFRKLLMKNREIVHGAFVLDETGKKVIFRDTLQLESLDLNELEATINSLGLLLSEYYNELIEFSQP